MQYINRSDRFIKTATFTKPVRDSGGKVREVAEYAKWHNIDECSKVQVGFIILEIAVNGNKAYILKDSFGMMASYPTQDLAEMKAFLVGKGFKPIKDWYLQECGMSEETWREWNSSND